MIDPDKSIFFQEPSADAFEGPVLKVLDGDTFLTKIALCHLTDNSEDQAEIKATVRFGFIDAPELEQRGGCEARDFLTNLIGGRKVWIDILKKMDTGKSFDHYGRVVAVPYLGDRYPASILNGEINVLNRTQFKNRSLYLSRNIEIEMVLNGWAWVLERYEPDEIYFEALEVAQRNKRGIWAYDDNVSPSAFKRQKYNDSRRSANKSKPVKKCPSEGCDGNLLKRNGKFGAFYGCSNYPDCRYSCSI